VVLFFKLKKYFAEFQTHATGRGGVGGGKLRRCSVRGFGGISPVA